MYQESVSLSWTITKPRDIYKIIESLFLWLSFFFFHFCARVKKDNIQLFIYMMDRTHKKNIDVVRNTKRIGLLVKIFVFLFIFFVVILSSFILLMQIHVLR